MDLQQFGKRLRLIRKQLGLTQVQVATETHLSQIAISRVENGDEIYASALIAIQYFYMSKISLDFLIADDLDAEDILLLQEEYEKRQQKIRFIVREICASTEKNLQKLEMLQQLIII